jgi:hypothetical protein
MTGESLPQLRYGPFPVERRQIVSFLVVLPVVLTFVLQGLHRSSVSCTRERRGVTCALTELPSGVGDAFSPVSARSTRQIVRGRSGPHAIGTLVVLDTLGQQHESIAVSYDESLELAAELQRYLDGTQAQFDGVLYDFRFGLVLGGLFLALGGLALRAGLSGSGWVELVFDRQRGRLTATRRCCGLAISRTELDVSGVQAVDIAWHREPSKNATRADLSARLCLWMHTPNGSAFIPERFARGDIVHLQGAAALRELLSLTPVDTQIYNPSLPIPKGKLSDQIEAIAVGAACGAVHGLCLLASLQFCYGSRSLPLAGSSGWLIVAGAALGAFIVLCWSRLASD